MKKRVVFAVLALFASVQLDAVSRIRALKCSIPKLHTKFNCTAEEKAVGRKWLIGTSLAAAAAALAALLGISAREVKKAKEEQVGTITPPTWQQMKYTYLLKDGWDKVLVEAALAGNEWKLVTILSELQNKTELAKTSLQAFDAALEAAQFWQKSGEKRLSEEIMNQIRRAKADRVALQEKGGVSQELPPGAPPMLETPPMVPNPEF